MSDNPSCGDDVPVADAAEQQRPITGDIPAIEGAEVPIDSNPADWQEQQEIVEDDDADDWR